VWPSSGSRAPSRLPAVHMNPELTYLLGISGRAGNPEFLRSLTQVGAPAALTPLFATKNLDTLTPAPIPVCGGGSLEALGKVAQQWLILLHRQHWAL